MGKFSQKDIDDIKKETGYSDVAVKNWYTTIKPVCPPDKIPLRCVSTLLEIRSSDAPTFMERLSQEFPNKNYFTFKEFMMMDPDNLGARLLNQKS